MDPYKLVPRRDWVVVLDDCRKEELTSGIVLPVTPTAERLSQKSGTIIAVGVGNKNKELGLTPDTRVAYRFHMSYAQPLPIDDRWPDGSKKQYFFMATDDLLMVLEPTTEVGFLSEPKDS